MKLASACLGLLGLLAPLAGSAAPLSLEAAIQLAMQSNPGMVIAAADQDIADAQLRQARSAALPQVVVVAQANRGNADLGGYFGFGRQTAEPRSAAVELRQPLYAGGAIWAGIDQAKQALGAAQANTQSSRLRLAVQAVQVYGAVLSARTMAEQTARYLAAASEIARSAALRFEAGEIPRSDWALAQSREAEGQAQVAQAAAVLATAAANFQATIGTDAQELLPLPAVAAPTTDTSALLTLAEQTNSDLAAARAAAEAARNGIQIAQAKRLPSLTLTARASSVRDEFLPGYRAQGNTIGIEGKWNLYTAGATSASLDAARASARRAEAQLAQQQSQLRGAVLSTVALLRSNETAVRAAAVQLDASDQALTSLRHEVRVGQRPLLDLLDAERDRLTAALSLATARAALCTTAWQLAALTGQTP